MSENISCPVNHVVINENQARLNALPVFLIVLSYFFVPYWGIPAFLVADFFLRGFGKGLYSPLNAISGWLVRSLSIKNKPIDQAPKLFAAQLGFLLADLLFLANVFSLKNAAYSIDGIRCYFPFWSLPQDFVQAVTCIRLSENYFLKPVCKNRAGRTGRPSGIINHH